MSVMFRVWNAVISLSMVEPKSVMCDGDWGNRGVGNWEWSGVERNGVEQSGTERNKNNKNKNKGKNAISSHHQAHKTPRVADGNKIALSTT